MNPVSREELARMLSELSDDALQYVQLPIQCAYYYTDFHDQDRLSDDDSRRFDLIGTTVHSSKAAVKYLVRMRKAYEGIECKNVAIT